MNHGGLGLIDENYSIHLDYDMLAALCLGTNSQLYGIYYPRKKYPKETDDSRYKSSTLNHDFMLTPIPPEYWPISARITMMVTQKKGSIDKICHALKEKKVSIIHSESTRSAHRYATWSLHIAFENLLEVNFSEEDFDEEAHVFKKTRIQLEELIAYLKNAFGNEIIFSPDTTQQKIIGYVNAPLAYFYHYIKFEKEGLELYQPFSIKLSTDKLFYSDSFKNKLKKINEQTGEKIAPCTFFSELHFGSLNIRFAVIPSEKLNRFLKFGVQFSTKSSSCIGIFKDVTSIIASEFNIWHSYNYTIESGANGNTGRIVFMVEYLGKEITPEDEKSDAFLYSRKLDGILKKGLAKLKEKSGTEFKLHPSLPLPSPEAGINILKKKQLEKEKDKLVYDLFISYSHDDHKNEKLKKRFDFFLGKLKEHSLTPSFDREQRVSFGKTLRPELVDRIRQSREVCVFETASSKMKPWVNFEYGVAFALEKNIVPVRFSEKIPSDYQFSSFPIKWINGNDDNEIEDYVASLAQKKYWEDAERYWKYFGI